MTDFAGTAFDKQTLKLPCRDCGTKTPITVAWLRKHNKFACAGCGKANGVDVNKLLFDLAKRLGLQSVPEKK